MLQSRQFFAQELSVLRSPRCRECGHGIGNRLFSVLKPPFERSNKDLRYYVILANLHREGLPGKVKAASAGRR